LLRRVQEHRDKTTPSFTSRYNIWKLVYLQQTLEVFSALEREKQLKVGSRASKVALVESSNPRWRDLYLDLLNGVLGVKDCFGLADAMASQ
jgi:putative endonuclease